MESPENIGSRIYVRWVNAIIQCVILVCCVCRTTEGVAMTLEGRNDQGFLAAVERLIDDSFLGIYADCEKCSETEFFAASDQISFKTQEELALAIQQFSIDYFPNGMSFEELLGKLRDEIPGCKMFDRPKRDKIQCNIVKTVPAPQWMEDENIVQLPFLIKMKFLSSEDRLTLDGRNVWIELDLI